MMPSNRSKMLYRCGNGAIRLISANNATLQWLLQNTLVENCNWLIRGGLLGVKAPCGIDLPTSVLVIRSLKTPARWSRVPIWFMALRCYEREYGPFKCRCQM